MRSTSTLKSNCDLHTLANAMLMVPSKWDRGWLSSEQSEHKWAGKDNPVTARNHAAWSIRRHTSML
eukprot:6110348-Amphidinium_carterae.1